MREVDINCDLGEGVGNEAELMPYLSSCNIACGGHAGDASTMRQVAKLANAHQVKIGAHPSFPDRENFGRVDMDISMDTLRASLTEQVKQLQAILNDEGLQLHHVKLHGALYNRAAKDAKTANLIVEAILSIDPDLVLYAPYHSVISEIATDRGVKIAYEAFMDRNYNDDLSLVSRKQPNALIAAPEAICDHVLRMVKSHQVKTISERLFPIKADSFCMHGDGKNVVQNLKTVVEKLRQNHIGIK